jgi:SEC-C motif-containing protein
MKRRTTRTTLLVVLLVCLQGPLAASSFAVKKVGGKKRVTDNAKGFGANPLTWQEVAAKFKTRIPRDADNTPCPCGSGSVYGNCCGPYHRGDKYPESPLAVLRSRYTAFCWRDIRYVVETTHPNCSDWQEDRIAWVKDLNKGGMFDNHHFVALEPGREEFVSENEGFITFTVTLRGHEGSAFQDQERIIRERSQFLKEDERWTYASGEVTLE